MRILIHCNAGAGIGVGHVVRSVALGEEALASGHDVTIAGEYESDFILRLLQEVAVDLRPIARSDTDGLRALVASVAPDIVHIDSYDELDLNLDLPADSMPLLSNIEDGTFGRRRADLIIDPNFGAETEARVSEEPRLLLRGSRYALLRRKVTRRRGEWQMRDDALRVLVVMGGTDPHQLTPRVLSVLAATELPLRVTAIVGEDQRAACASAARALDVDLLEPVDDLAGLMVQHDLVVSAAGTSVWELCCIGVPMALVCAAENQRAGYDRVVAAGAALGLESSLERGETDIAATQLRKVLGNAATRQELAGRASALVDGLGSWRIVRTWEQAISTPEAVPAHQDLQIRGASLADAETLLRWRNDPGARKGSRQQNEVTLDQHLAWFEASLGRDDRILLVASDKDGEAGTVRWDRVSDGEWEVSITVAPERRGRGLALPLLSAGERDLVRRTGAATALADVHEDNVPSRRLFAVAGYLPDSPPDRDGFMGYRKVMAAQNFRSGPN